MLFPIVCWLLVINAVAATSFWLDKRYAIEGRRRIREATLLQMAFLGGSPGALVARRAFRHKTRKEPFSTYLLLIVMVQAGAVIGLFLI